MKEKFPGAWAVTSDGVIYLSDSIPDALADVVGHHEVVHAVKQRGSSEYQALLDDVGGRINYRDKTAKKVMDAILNSRFRGKSFFDLSPAEIKTAYDEMNALVWGYYKADPEHARAEFGGVFTDFDGYIAELDAVMEGVRGAYAEGGRTPPGGEGAALDAGERRALEEGWRDEEPSVRGPGNDETDAADGFDIGDSGLIETDYQPISPSGVYDPDAAPGGRPSQLYRKMNESTRRSITRENEAARTLAQWGYAVEQQPETGGAKKPDYRIEGRIFDCYSPQAGQSARGIWIGIQKKLSRGRQGGLF
nr:MULTISPECIES: hypothetical protein [unclassified Pseudoflavonifractor]